MRSLMHLLKFTVGLEGPASQVTEDELEMLMQYSRGVAVICELGCYEGRSSVAFALNTTGAVYAVDPFIGGRLGVCYTEGVSRNHRRRQRAKNLLFFRGLSGDVVPKFKRAINFFFFHADHSYEGAQAHWGQWVSQV